MGMIFKSSDNNQAKKPFGATRGTFLLLDDIAHRGIHKVAGKIEEKTGIGKEKLAGYSIASGAMADIALNYNKGPEIAITAIGIPILLFMNKQLIESSKMRGEGAENYTNWVLKHIRFPYLVGGVAPGIIGGYIGNKLLCGTGLFFTGHAISFYLISSDNGVLDRVKEWVGAKWRELTHKSELQQTS